MKVLIFTAGVFLVATLFPLLTCGKGRGRPKQDTLLIVSSDVMDKILHEMPLRSMNVYSDRFYPTMIKSINKKLYSRRARTKSLPVEKRIRNIKLNQFLNIPNDRQDDNGKSSSFAYLAKNESSSFVIYTIPGGKRGKQIIHFQSPDNACIFGMSEERTAVKAKKCREDVPNMAFNLIPNHYGDFWIQQYGTKLCLAPVLNMGEPFLLQLLACDRYNPYLIWEIQDAFIYYKK